MSAEAKIDKLIEEFGGVGDFLEKHIKNPVKKLYNNTLQTGRDELIKNDLLEPKRSDFQGNRAIFKDDEIILSPKVMGDAAAMKAIPYAFRSSEGFDMPSIIKAQQKTLAHVNDYVTDQNKMKESEDILSAMMKKPVRFSDEYKNEDTTKEGIGALSNSFFDQQINAQRYNGDMSRSSVLNKIQGNILHADKLSPLQQRELFNSKDFEKLNDSLPFDTI